MQPEDVRTLADVASHDISVPVAKLQLRQWYDVKDRGECNNICTVLGFLQAIKSTLRVREGGTLFAGLPCSSILVFKCCFLPCLYMVLLMCRAGLHSKLRWVWMSTGTTMRHVCVLGDQRALHGFGQ